MNRRSIIVLLIGVVSALAGFAAAALVEQNRCVSAAGRWNAAIRQCQLVNGDLTGFGFRSAIAGVVVGLLLAVMLYRTVSFFAMRASRPPA